MQKHTHPNNPTRGGGAKSKPQPKHTHPYRRPQPGLAGNRSRAHTNTHTPQHPSQEWPGGAETRAQAHTPTPHTPARIGRVQEERPHKRTDTPTPQPGMAEYRPGVHTDTHTPPPQAGVAGRNRTPSCSTHTHTAHPSYDWRGTGGARTQTITDRNTPARIGGTEPKPEPKHTHPHHAPQPRLAGYKRSAHTNTHTPENPSQEWRGVAETRAQTHTPTPHTPARIGGVQEDRAHNHTQTVTAEPGVAGRSRNPSPSRHTHRAHPSQEWRGTSGARTQTHTPQNPSQDWRGAS